MTLNGSKMEKSSEHLIIDISVIAACRERTPSDEADSCRDRTTVYDIVIFFGLSSAIFHLSAGKPVGKDMARRGAHFGMGPMARK